MHMLLTTAHDKRQRHFAFMKDRRLFAVHPSHPLAVFHTDPGARRREANAP